jgi:hypothetical protein
MGAGRAPAKSLRPPSLESGAQRLAAAAALPSACLSDDLVRGSLTPDEHLQRHEANGADPAPSPEQRAGSS